MFSILFRLVKKGLNKEEKVMLAKYNLGLEAQRLEWLKLKPMMDIEGTYIIAIRDLENITFYETFVETID